MAQAQDVIGPTLEELQELASKQDSGTEVERLQQAAADAWRGIAERERAKGSQ